MSKERMGSDTKEDGIERFMVRTNEFGTIRLRVRELTGEPGFVPNDSAEFRRWADRALPRNVERSRRRTGYDK